MVQNTIYNYNKTIEFPVNFDSELNKDLLELISKYYRVSFPLGYSKSIDNIGGLINTIDFGWKYYFTLDKKDTIYIWNETVLDINISKIISGFTKIIFNRGFNQSIDNLPNTIEDIKLSYNFNHPIDNLPRTLSDER